MAIAGAIGSNSGIASIAPEGTSFESISKMQRPDPTFRLASVQEATMCAHAARHVVVGG
jgi:hypothetical protein